MVRCPNCGEGLDVVPRHTPRSLAHRCADAAGQLCCVPTVDVMGPRRLARYIRPRKLAMWAMRELGASFPEIGASFGRDHSTVQYACRTVEQDFDLKQLGLQVIERVRTL